MAVTKKSRSVATLGLLGACLLFGYQNCMVDLAKTTPGASSTSCSPDSTALSEFQIVEDSILLPTGSISGTTKDACGSCHGQTAVSAGKNVFLLLGVAGSEDTVTSTANFCTMQLKGASRLAHPSDGSHSGGLYTTTDIPTYYSLISKYF